MGFLELNVKRGVGGAASHYRPTYTPVGSHPPRLQLQYTKISYSVHDITQGGITYYGKGGGREGLGDTSLQFRERQ